MQKERRNADLKNVKIYIDTCILQGALSRQNTKDTIFMDKIKENGWSVYTSIHTLMELLDVSKDRKFLMKKIFDERSSVKDFLRSRDRKNLNNNELEDISTEINNFFRIHKSITLGNITEDVWTDVKSIAEKSNIHYSDVIHLVLAIMWDCHVLVTHDQFFINEGNKILRNAETPVNLKLCDVENVEKKLEEIFSKD